MPKTDRDTRRGVYRKFEVSRADGSTKHEDCTYFVLDLDHDPFAIPALRAYAKACRAIYPKLALDLVRVTKARNPAEALEEMVREPNGR